MKRIGLFGGTFDPVHLGHVRIAESFLSSGLIDELWVLLTPYPPHKLNGNQVSYSLRLKMLEAAFSSMHKLQISTIENDLSKPSYTVNTIRFFKSQYKNQEYFFCMGEDSLIQFHTWKYYNEILSEAKLLVACRPGNSHSQVDPAILKRAFFVDHIPLSVSSSGIRQMIKEGKDISRCVPQSVQYIIRVNSLYAEK